MAEQSWKLKVLTGPYLGVVVDLPAGKFIIGDDDGKSDVVFSGYKLSPAHLLFEVNENNELYASLLDKESTIIFNDNPSDEERTLVKDSSIVKTGEISLAIVCGDTPWPEDPSKKEEKQKEGTDSEAKDTVADKEKVVKKQHPIVRSLVTTFAIFMIIMSPIVTLLVADVLRQEEDLSYLQKFQGKDYAARNSITEIKKIIYNNFFSHVVANLSPDGSTVVISGYVKARAELERLAFLLRNVEVKPIIKVKIMENIVKAVSDILVRNGFDGLEAYEGDEMGVVVLKGYISDYSNFSKLENDLDTKVPGLKSWSVQYIKSRKLVVIFKKMLASVGISGDLSIEMYGKELIVRVDLDARQSKIFYQQAEYFRRKYGFSPILESYTQNMATTDLDIISVEIGRNPRVTLKGGQVYLIGSKLPNGFIIKEIARNGMTMIKGSKAMFYQFQGTLNNE